MVSKGDEDEPDFGDDFDEGGRVDVNPSLVAKESEQLGHKGKAYEESKEESHQEG